MSNPSQQARWHTYLGSSQDDNVLKNFTFHRQSFRYLFTQPNLIRRQCRWMDLLQEFDFGLYYIKGKENGVANALSTPHTAHAILCIESSLIDEIKIHYMNNNVFELLFKNIYRGSMFIEEIEQFKSYGLINSTCIKKKHLHTNSLQQCLERFLDK